MFKLILFDLDGTLTDPKEGITNCVKYALESFGIVENDEAVLLRFIGPPLTDMFRSAYGVSDDDANKLLEKYRERFSTVGLFENSLLPGAESLLMSLKNAGFKIALATSKPIIFADRIIEKYGIKKYFDYVVGSELDGRLAYKDQVIDEVLKQANIKNLSDAIMVGDRKQDILGAKKCGIASVGLRCGYAEKNELEDAGADFILDDLFALKDFFIK